MAPCPPEADLLAFHLGRLAESDLNRVASHLADCPRCETTLDGFDATGDELVEALARPRPAFADDSAIAEPRLPGYELLGIAGRGGMGVVYKARQAALNRLVAVKVVLGGAFADPAARARLRREATAVARLRHANIVQIHEVGEHAGLPYVTLEWVEGGSLDAATAGRPIPPRDAAHLLEAVARGIHHAHQNGVVHRDLKPANILLARIEDRGSSIEEFARSSILDPRSSSPKVTDFGLARHPDDGQLTATGALAGTPSYMAPEQSAGGAVGPAADVYASGAILYEMLTGRPPFRGEDALATLAMAREQAPVAPRQLAPAVPRDLETVCLKCLEKEPGRRYGSAAALADDLERFLDGRPVAARRTPAWEHVWRWAQRRPVLAASLALLQIALAVIASGYAYYSARLGDALKQANRAEQQSAASAKTALEALNSLVFDVQTQLRKGPETRPLRRKLLETALAGLEKVAATGEAGDPQVSRAAALVQVGQINAQLGRVPAAIEAFERARQAADAVLARQSDDSDARHYWADATRGMGLNQLNGGQADRARVVFTELVTRLKSWAADAPDDGRLRWDLVLAHEQLGHAQQWVHDFARAGDSYKAMHELARAWLAAVPQAEAAQAAVARSLHLLGTLARDRKDPAATAFFAESLERYRPLVAAKPDAEPHQRGLMINVFALAELAKDRGDWDSALRFGDESLTLARRHAAGDPTNLERQLVLVDTLYQCGDIAAGAGKKADAVKHYEESLEHLDRLDRAGQLDGRPVYKLERRDQISAALARCRAP